MSIWSSIGNPIGVGDVRHPDTNVYEGIATKTIELDVAHCGGWHHMVRLAAWSADPDHRLGVDLLLDRDALIRLRDRLDLALSIVDAATPGDPS